MKVKSFIFFALILLFVNFCIGQSVKSNCELSKNSKSHNDSIYFDKNLREFYVDSCLYDLFKAVVNADSSHINYAPAIYFYSLDFFYDKSGRPYLSIYPRLWANSKHLDYTGIIRLGRMNFLCRGDFATDSRFHSSPLKKVRVKLKQAKSNSFNVVFTEDPSFQGSFADCTELPIYIEIYIKGKIADFEMDIQDKK